MRRKIGFSPRRASSSLQTSTVSAGCQRRSAEAVAFSFF
jgi:hypothetical protein